MRRLSLSLLLFAAPSLAQPVQPPVAPAPLPTLVAPPPVTAVFTPASAYIAPGQDAAGYASWVASNPLRLELVTGFENYLKHYQVAGVVPTWQLLRTATSWHRCGAQPFEIPPTYEWSHLVQTLRYVETHVIPVIGPVEVVSGYRNPALNVCAGGAPESAHRHFAAIDMVPLRPIDRDGLIQSLCAIHAWRGEGYQVGLGFYAFHRFHVDTTKFRKWGADTTPEASSCHSALATMHIASVKAVEAKQAAAAAATTPAPPTETETAPTTTVTAAPAPSVAPVSPPAPAPSVAPLPPPATVPPPTDPAAK